MTKESWITIGNSVTTKSWLCVNYHRNYARVKFQRCNVTRELISLLKKLYPKDELREKAGNQEMIRVSVDIYCVEQVAADKKKMRLVLSKNPQKDCSAQEMIYIIEGEKWLKVLFPPLGWGVNTRDIAHFLGSETVVFVDSLGQPTRSPQFTLWEEGGNIVISAPIKGATLEEANQVLKKRK